MNTSNKIRIVFLDSSTITRGDVSFDAFTSKWDCVFHERTDPSRLAERIAGCTVAVTNKVVFDAAIMDAPEAADLKLIAVAATGTNNVDIEAAREKGIAIANVAGYSTNCVAQHTFALLFELANSIGYYASRMRYGAWQESPIFTMLDRPIIEMSGKTMGIVGHGAIGGAVADAARGFGMNAILSQRPGQQGPPPEGRVPFDEVLKRSDVLSLHCPLTPETGNLIGARELEIMKPTAFLINVARGGIVVEDELVKALKEKQIAGAAFDVLTTEPPPTDNPLIKAAADLPNLVITPHVAWASFEARQRLLDEVALNVDAFLNGQDRNRIA